MAKLAETKYPLPEIDFKKRYPESNKEQEAAFSALCKKSDSIDPEKDGLVGLLVSFHYADGLAHYIVTKERPLTLQSVPYSDAWQLPYGHIRGLNKQDILAHVGRRRGLAAMFGHA